MFMSIMSSKSTLLIQTIMALGLFFEPIPVGFVGDLIDDMKSYLSTYMYYDHGCVSYTPLPSAGEGRGVYDTHP